MDSLALLKIDEAALQNPVKTIRAIGIDLGTTNSTVAEILINPNDSFPPLVRCLEINQETNEGVYTHLLVPSVVALNSGKIIVGEGAKRLRARSPELNLAQNKDIFYECKNDIGIEKTYHRAPPGFKNAADIGSKVLSFLLDAAKEENEIPIDRVVVTVPASFQAAQRNDTLKAATMAGFNVKGGDLLDEPVAAFIDYLASYGKDLIEELKKPKNLIVFDFGGGTCDVAIFKIWITKKGEPINIAPLSVSRYHRLGGGDIDRAILHDVLLPQIFDQNNLTKHDLDYEDKKISIEPAFLSTAEALKISLCSEISRLKQFGKYDDADKSSVKSKQPGRHSCKVQDREILLTSPTLSAEQFEKLLEPFIETDLLYARETEYRMTCSIFAPIQDALDRCEMEPDKIDYCLMVGGSSLIPQIVGAIDEYLEDAKILIYPDKESIQTTVARGAAYHAISLKLFGKSIIQPICHDTISIRTATGKVELIPKGNKLPFPGNDDYAECKLLAVPENVLFEPIELKVEIIAGEEERKLFSKLWTISETSRKGDPLYLKYRFDENQILHLNLFLKDDSNSQALSVSIENPLTNVVNPQTIRVKIEEIEEKLRKGMILRNDIPDTFTELARMYADIAQPEKAIALLKKALQAKQEADVEVLNLLGINSGVIGDYKNEEKYYLEAAKFTTWTGPLFNLALSKKSQGLHEEALKIINRAVTGDRDAPDFVLKAQIEEALGDDSEREISLKRALSTFDPLSAMSDWEIIWYITALRMTGQFDKIEKAKKEQKRRRKNVPEDIEEGQLPITLQGLMRIEK